MQPILILLTCLAAPPEGVTATSVAAREPVQTRESSAIAPAAAEPTPRSPRELAGAVGEAIRRFNRAEGESREALVPELAALYREVRDHTQLESRMQSRLLRLLERKLRDMEASLARRFKREDQPAERGQRPPSAALWSRTRRPAGTSPLAASNRSPVLAQPGARAAGFGGAGAASGGIGQATSQQAQDLIDLVRTTIAPNTWDVNGGKGTIYYFRPSQALVIRQTSEVHRQIGGALGQLRR